MIAAVEYCARFSRTHSVGDSLRRIIARRIATSLHGKLKITSSTLTIGGKSVKAPTNRSQNNEALSHVLSKEPTKPARPSELEQSVNRQDKEKRRPYTLPPGAYRPKQSLGQNFLSDQNYVERIVRKFQESGDVEHLGPEGRRVVEIGSGAGALTKVLFPLFPDMTAVEIDERGVSFLRRKLGGVVDSDSAHADAAADSSIRILHMDVLDCDWPSMARSAGGRLAVIGNLPYNVTSQILFNLADNSHVIGRVVITSQWEFAQRMVARPGTKAYGIPSVVFQLYASPSLSFKIPPTVFYPVPKVDSALLAMDFSRPLMTPASPSTPAVPAISTVDPTNLRKVLSAAFRKRRKMLRHSLRELLADIHNSRLQKEGARGDTQGATGLVLSERWETRRPEQLTPLEFVELTTELYGPVSDETHRQKHSNQLWSLLEKDLKGEGASYTQKNGLITAAPAWRSSSSKGGRTVTPKANKDEQGDQIHQ